MRTIVFFGQCQAAYMGDVYGAHIADPAEDKVVKIDSNFDLRPSDLEMLAEADVVVTGLYETAKFIVTPNAAPRALIIPFPTAAFQALWPFGRSAHPAAPDVWYQDKGWQAFYGDDFINRLLRKGMTPDEAVEAYLAVDVTRTAHLDRQYELAMEMQRHRDAQANLLDLAGLIDGLFQKKRLFKLPTHPLNEVFLATCSAVFQRLGVPPVAISRMKAANQDPVIAGDFLPVHPGVAKYFCLEWSNASTENLFASEGPLTFREYCLRHAHYSWNMTLAEGISLGIAGRYAEAIPKLEAGLAGSPRAVAGYILLALAYVQIKKNAEALKTACVAEALDARDFRGPFLQGVSLHALGDFRSASIAFDRAEQLNPGNVEVLAWHRNNYRSAGLKELAHRYALNAQAACPSNPRYNAAQFVRTLQ